MCQETADSYKALLETLNFFAKDPPWAAEKCPPRTAPARFNLIGESDSSGVSYGESKEWRESMVAEKQECRVINPD